MLVIVGERLLKYMQKSFKLSAFGQQLHELNLLIISTKLCIILVLTCSLAMKLVLLGQVLVIFYFFSQRAGLTWIKHAKGHLLQKM